jgi:hypothetical protein
MSAPPPASHETYAFVDHRGRVSKISVYQALEIARSRVTRGFTEDECATYHIDPWPDLETSQGG